MDVLLYTSIIKVNFILIMNFSYKLYLVYKNMWCSAKNHKIVDDCNL